MLHSTDACTVVGSLLAKHMPSWVHSGRLRMLISCRNGTFLSGSAVFGQTSQLCSQLVTNPSSCCLRAKNLSTANTVTHGSTFVCP